MANLPWLEERERQMIDEYIETGDEALLLTIAVNQMFQMALSKPVKHADDCDCMVCECERAG